MAEESAQPAFESIEAFIRGFSSVTMMLESTFQVSLELIRLEIFY